MNSRMLVFFTLALVASLPRCRAAEAAGKSLPPPKPELPPIRSLKVEPAALTLDDGRDERRVLVWAETAAGQRFDVTDDAVLKTESPEIEIGTSGYIEPR